jgi:hypothetical protein
VPPFDCALKHALDHDQRLAGGCVADAGCVHLSAQVPEQFGCEGADREVAELGDDVDIEHRGVGELRMPREVGNDVARPPQLREIGDRLVIGGDRRERAESLGPLELLVEGLGVCLAAHDPRVRVALFVAPAHTPDGATCALNLLDAHP